MCELIDAAYARNQEGGGQEPQQAAAPAPQPTPEPAAANPAAASLVAAIASGQLPPAMQGLSFDQLCQLLGTQK